MRVIRSGLCALALALLSGCPGQLEQFAWLPDGGAPPLTGEPPTTAYAPGPTPDGGAASNPAMNLDAGAVKADAAKIPAVDAAVVPPPPDAAPAPKPDAGTPIALACATAAEIDTKILVPKCGACHGKNAPAAGLDLVTPGSKARMMDVPARGCAGRPLVTVAGGAAGGHFFDKLAGSVQNCGGQMPFGTPPLSAQEIECLKRWIAP